MSVPRRRIIRPALPTAREDPRSVQQLQKLRIRLEKEHQFLARWMSRLKRAFNAVDKQRRIIHRLQRQIHKQEGA